MKIIYKLSVLFALTTTLLACQNEETPVVSSVAKEPVLTEHVSNRDYLPSLTLRFGVETIPTTVGIYTWTGVDEKTGESISIEAQALSPQEIVHNDNHLFIDSTAKIDVNFETEPITYEVKLWDEEKTVATYA